MCCLIRRFAAYVLPNTDNYFLHGAEILPVLLSGGMARKRPFAYKKRRSEKKLAQDDPGRHHHQSNH